MNQHMEINPTVTRANEATFLIPGKYPFIFKIAGILLLSFIFFVYFVELPQHFALVKQVIRAEQAFETGNYEKALELYLPIVQEHSHFKKARIRIVAAYFHIAVKSTGLKRYQAYQEGLNRFGSIIFEKKDDWDYFVSSVPLEIAQEIRKGRK